MRMFGGCACSFDERLPRKAEPELYGHECLTLAKAGWSGKKKGELLAGRHRIST